MKSNCEQRQNGRIGEDEARARFARITGTLALEDLADRDLIIEAVFENMDVKKKLGSRAPGTAAGRHPGQQHPT